MSSSRWTMGAWCSRASAPMLQRTVRWKACSASVSQCEKSTAAPWRSRRAPDSHPTQRAGMGLCLAHPLPENAMYKRILLAYDGSDAGQKALLDTKDIAHWSDAELFLIAVMPSAMSFVGLEGG